MSMQNVLRYALANNSTLALAISQYRKVNDELLALSKSARKKPRRKEKACLQLSLQEPTDISILFMQADLDIHCSDVRLREGLAVGGGPEYAPSIYHHQTDILTQNSTALLRILQKSSSLRGRIAETQFRASCKLPPLCTLRLR
ncbi:hypothetical protein T02_14283 [Trichinella nativa]|uniref:Uncharacterized protein n=1 Tax=Trichinella nativa TaxID=6335 RepID=A0A0V1KNT6_9BILA|nr:hypothetical protein T02_14283 [Trichinella nativa]